MTQIESPESVYVEIADGGDVDHYSLSEYVHEGGSASALSVIAAKQAMLSDGTLVDEVQHNEHVVERAIDEGAFVARVSIPYWFVNKDDEVQDTFGAKHENVTCLVEDYSEKAWRVIAQDAGAHGDSWFNWAWTFLPKSVVRVTHVEGVEDRDHYWDDLYDEIHDARIAHREDDWGDEWDDI